MYVCILQTNQVAEAWSLDILVECNYEWSILTCVHSAYAHGTEVAAG